VQSCVLRFLSDESGATAIEYGLIIAAIALAVFPAMKSMSGAMIAKLTAIGTGLK
jgi:pilus assembly protein Flp/PilA